MSEEASVVTPPEEKPVPPEEVTEPPTAEQIQESLRPVQEIGMTLLAVSAFLIGAVGFFRLDLLPGTLLGSGVVGLNYIWTRRIVVNVFQGDNVKRRMSLLYFIKFGVSVAVLFTALVVFQLAPLGVLLGVSNIVLAVMIHTVLTALRPQRPLNS